MQGQVVGAVAVEIGCWAGCRGLGWVSGSYRSIIPVSLWTSIGGHRERDFEKVCRAMDMRNRDLTGSGAK